MLAYILGGPGVHRAASRTQKTKNGPVGRVGRSSNNILAVGNIT